MPFAMNIFMALALSNDDLELDATPVVVPIVVVVMALDDSEEMRDRGGTDTESLKEDDRSW